jgi:hypothetical protein
VLIYAPVTFKADFDVLGTKNSFQVTELKTVKQSQPWFPELGLFDQMELQASNLRLEKQLNFAENGQAMYTVISDKTNAWGEKRGYRMCSPDNFPLFILFHIFPFGLLPLFAKQAQGR